MSFSPSFGFSPETYLELMEKYFQKFNELTNQNKSFAEYQGTQNFQVSDLFAKLIVDEQQITASLLVSIFNFFKDQQNIINEGLGASYTGWYNTFKDKVVSINLVTPEPGKLRVYFDDPQEGQEFIDLFKNCLGAGIVLDNSLPDFITGNFTDSLGVSRPVYYYRLLPADYTPLFVKIKYSLKSGGIPVIESDLKDLFEERFNLVNGIGVKFYPDSYVSSQDFTGVADFEIESGLDDISYMGGIKDPSEGGKFTIANIVVEIL